MANIERPDFQDDPVVNQRTAMGIVLIDPATGQPYKIEGPQDVFLQDIYNWTGSQVVNTGQFLNFLSLSGVAKEAGGTANTDLAASLLKFPAKAKWSQVIFNVRMTGTIGGGVGTPREWMTQTRHIDGTTLVGSSADVKVDGLDISNRDATLISWTRDALDPFTVDGIQVGLNNVSGQTITLTSVSVRIQRIVNPEFA